MIGAVAIVLGLALVLLGRTNIPLGRLPGDIVYRREEQHVLFSAGDVDSGQRGAFGGDVFDWAVAAVGRGP